MSDHARNTAPMLTTLRCGVRTRTGEPCRAPAVRGKRRCRMHGGTPRSGAPSRNRNARKHGLFTGEAIAGRKQVQAVLADAWRLLREMK